MDRAEQLELQRDTVIPLITETGFPIILTRKTEYRYDPDIGEIPGETIEFNGNAIEIEMETSNLPESLASSVLKEIMAINLTDVKVKNDKITLKNKEYSIIKSEPFEIGTVLFYHTLYLGA